MEGKIQKWFNKGLNTIGDLIGEDGNLMSMDKIKELFRKSVTFCYTLGLRKKQDILKKQNIFIWNKQMPQLPYVLYFLDLGTKGDKNVYFSTIESGNSILKQAQENWSKNQNDDITFDTVTKGFENIKTIAPSVH